MGDGLSDAPRLLALETATRVMSVALLRGEQLEAEISSEDERMHSERLLPAVDQLLATAGLPLEAVECFAVSIGPGSFTGLRVAVATVKGLSFGDARPVAAVPTLAALAAGAAAAPGAVAAMLDARRGEVYAAAYPAPGSLQPVLAEGVYLPEELASALPDECTLVVGEGAGAVAARVAEVRSDLDLLAEGLVQPRALQVARLGQCMIAEGLAIASEDLIPRYLRRAEAEVKRTGQRFE